MASLFKPTYTVIDKKTGEKRQRKAKKWYGQYRDADGHLKRVPLCTDKEAAQAMLNKKVKQAEREGVGIRDWTFEHQAKPLASHVEDFQNYMLNKGDSFEHVGQVTRRLTALFTGCDFKRIGDIDAPTIVAWLADRRESKARFSIRTSNFYQDHAKTFCKWLVDNHRANGNPLSHLHRINIETDMRHERRAMTDEEFERLINAAESGPTIEGLCGLDRGMLYILSAFTGCRRKEIASLTDASFDFSRMPAVVRVAASNSKRRKAEEIPLHPELAKRFQAWREGKTLAPGANLFELRTPSGFFRKTAKMMERDLEAARAEWLKEAETDEDRDQRAQTDFLKYQDSNGDFADFHSNRHTFISNLSRSSVSPKMAQSLARHSDINLTMNTYTHVDLAQRSEAVNTLPAPPARKTTETTEALALELAQDSGAKGRTMTSDDVSGAPQAAARRGQEVENTPQKDTICHALAANGEVHPTGFEPVTFGFVDRCSIQLS